MLRSANPPTLESGLYETFTVTCLSPYTGPHAGRSVYVVGMGTEREAFFPRDRRADAVRLARDEDLTLDHLPAGQLCTEVVEAVFGV